MSRLKFGTDGWRAVIAKDYTFENLNIVARATAQWIEKSNISDNGVVVGYDARFLGRQFAEHAASVFAESGIAVRISTRISATPAISWAAKHYDAVGIVITASHNPPEYNGFKIKAPFGGSALPDHIDQVENELRHISEPLSVRPFQDYLRAGLIREMDFVAGYLDVLRERIDLKAIRNSGIRIAHDPMYGAGSGLIRELLGDAVVEVNTEHNPLFGGTAPEPVEEKLGKLADAVVMNGCAIGLANDGDADRIGMVNEKGEFVSSHQILSLLVKYLNQEKGLNGTIVKTFSTTDMLDKQAAKYRLPIEVTPIGFKYIVEKIIYGDILAAGEESGGLAVKGHLPERDGIYIGLLITEMLVKSGKKLSELVQELFEEFGPHQYYRNDILTEEKKKNAMAEFCRSKHLKEISGQKVVAWDQKDGVKHTLENGSWLLVRESGTEPVLRIYSEAATREEAMDLVEAVTAKVEDPSIHNHF